MAVTSDAGVSLNYGKHSISVNGNYGATAGGHTIVGAEATLTWDRTSKSNKFQMAEIYTGSTVEAAFRHPIASWESSQSMSYVARGLTFAAEGVGTMMNVMVNAYMPSGVVVKPINYTPPVAGDSNLSYEERVLRHNRGN